MKSPPGSPPESQSPPEAPSGLRAGLVARLALYGSLLAQFCGCAGRSRLAAEPAGGCLVMIPGVEGQRWQLAGTEAGLVEAGVRWRIEILDWGTPPLHSLPNLTDIQANRRRARERANRLAELRRENSSEPLVLVGFSGGGGLAILTVEALPKDVSIDRLILVAAAISKDYDLEQVLKQCNDKVINIYSNRDAMVGLGTSIFGTIDRKYGLSAGHCGFVDASGALVRNQKLLQVCWDPTWAQYGHFGGHLGYLSNAWAQQVLAPLIDPGLALARISRSELTQQASE